MYEFYLNYHYICLSSLMVYFYIELDWIVDLSLLYSLLYVTEKKKPQNKFGKKMKKNRFFCPPTCIHVNMYLF